MTRLRELGCVGLLAIAITAGAQNTELIPGDEIGITAAELEQQLAAAIAERDAARSEAARIVASAELELAAAQSARGALERLRRENASHEERMELYRGAIPWPWVAGALVVALAAGFVGGWWWLDTSIRRRYGGFKMY